MRRARAARVLVVVVAVAALAGCTTAPPSVEPSSVPSLGAGQSVRYEVEPGRSLAIACWGEGGPTVIYEAGTETSGINTLKHADPILQLAASTRVCSYDRASLGASDPAPDRARTVDDLTDDAHALFAAAGIAPPYVLVGSSGGGFDVYNFAGRYPDEVVGLIMDDVPSPQANLAATEVPAWDSGENPEHMDYVLFEHQLAVDRLPIPSIPVTVLWATHGQSATQDDQNLWLDGSSAPQSIAVESGHDITHGNPQAVADAIAAMLAALRP